MQNEALESALLARLEHSAEGWDNDGKIFHYRIRIAELGLTLWCDSKEHALRVIRDKSFP